MDRFALTGSLRAANARVVAGQWALLEQRNQVRQLEQCGLDASTAKALLQVYEESQAMSIIDRNCLRHSLTRLATDRASPVDYDDRGLYDAEDAEDDDYLRQAA